MSSAQAFVSFSARDESASDFVRLLWRRLNDQGLSVFRYETFQNEIPAGADIDHACKLQIEKSRYCFVVVSEASFGSSWARSEVKFAQELQRDSFLFPVAVVERSDWPKPYDQLRGIKRFLSLPDFHRMSVPEIEAALERSILAFCADQQLVYWPSRESRRLPLRRRLYTELWGARNLDRSHKAGILDQLLIRAGSLLESYANHDVEIALEELRSVIRQVTREFPEARLYYPRIVQSMFERELADGDRSALETTRRELTQLIVTSNPWVDANVHAMLGNIALDLGEPDQASEHFDVAGTFLTTLDPALVHNRVLAAVLAGDRERLSSLHALLLEVHAGANVEEERDFYRLRLLHALLSAAHGNDVAAIHKLSELGTIQETDFDLVRELVDTLTSYATRSHDYWRMQRAISLLESTESMAEQCSLSTWFSIVERLVLAYTELGEMDKATGVLERILTKKEFATSLKVLVDGCVVYLAADNPTAAVSCLERARSIHDMANQQPALTLREFHYYRGFAQWLDRKDELARDSYETHAGGAATGLWYADLYPWLDRNALARAM